MAKNRNIDFYYARGKNKADFIPMFSKFYQCESSEMLYVGDDLFDLSILQNVGYAFCPQDSPNKIKNFCGFSNIIDRDGGQNVVARLVDILLDRKLINDSTMKQIEELDKKEKF
jgi:3-deoxy-D-manno-octulosonate 8-phosphate phosphatase KdsC-like HAD superfamily phosphatase